MCLKPVFQKKNPSSAWHIMPGLPVMSDSIEWTFECNYRALHHLSTYNVSNVYALFVPTDTKLEWELQNTICLAVSLEMALFGLHFANNGLMGDEKSEATVLGRKPADFLRWAPHFLVRRTKWVEPKNEGRTAKSRLANVLKPSWALIRRPN